MAVAVKGEHDAHYYSKVAIEVIKNGVYKLPTHINIIVVTEEKLKGTNYIPDASIYSGNELIAVVEVVNKNPMSKVKYNYYKNHNITAFALNITRYVDLNQGISFSVWQHDFNDYISDAITGKNNSNKIFTTESWRNLHKNAIIDGKMVRFVRYEISNDGINEEKKFFNFFAFDKSGNKYHLLIAPSEILTKYTKRKYDHLRHNNEPIYALQSSKECWIDSLTGTKTFKRK